jgi:molecular chaperone DnaK
VVGWAARAPLAYDARRTVASIKRLLGHRYSDVHIAGHLQSVPFRTLAGPEDSILIEIDREQYAVPQVCAAIIAHARDLAEQTLEQRFTQVALSCPVTFAEEQKLALRRAAQLAGLEVVALVPEPVAGAMAYGLGEGKNEIVAVYDFGGGTFDFSLLDMSGDNVRLIASEGDGWLGGDDFDLQLAQAVADAFWRATKIELRQRLVEWQRLLQACEQAKRELTVSPQTAIVVDELVESPRRIDLRQKLDRTLFQRLTQGLFDRSLEVCRETLERAGLEPSDVTQLVVTGGVSRIPFVREGLGAFFEREVQAVVNPEEAIALGAGLRAAQAVEHPVRGIAKRG